MSPRRPRGEAARLAQGRRTSARRLRFCFVVIAMVLSLFAGRLFQLQGIDSGAYAARAVAEGTSTVTLHADRGEITDRNGAPLATSVDAVAITADPKMTASSATRIAEILVEHLGVDYFSTVTRLRQPNSRFAYLARKVPTYEADTAMSALEKAGLAGVFTERDALRTYPGGELAANVLGLVDAKGKGVAGLERSFDSRLSGKDGKATYETSPSGERIPLADSTVTEPRAGVGLRTTLDRDLQWYSDRRLAQAVTDCKCDWGLAITLDTRTSQVVQMSQAPSFDPNDRTFDMDDVGSKAWQAVYEPGSVQKVVTMAALADAGKITPTTKIKIPSEMEIDDFTIGDYWDHGTIKLTAAGVIAKSSNLGTILAAQQMKDAEMYDYLRDFGFGSRTDLGMSGESRGLLKKPEQWSRANHATIAFGQGISVTALQMVTAVSAIANGGMYVEPSLVNGYLKDGGVEPAGAPKEHRVVSKKAADMVTQMMETVTQKDGSAPMAAIPGYRVAGKTGTAWRVNPDTGRYVRGENTVSFAGFAPADDPRFVTYVVLDKPAGGGGGGVTAGPVFRDIMSTALQTYGVAPTGTKAPDTPTEW
ncbi:peptidoglycan D,D-transpeptidase FtsI family protein [Solicola sp. PLA-1-18]|uniref:peptidoglycan D,D-transpeptidase FtsI family protein n=1 Tax=Solicola sp. PLA-1-18 TaxID=3380532 RepID=UPI003B811809